MSTTVTISRDSDALTGMAKAFFEQVKNGQDDPEQNNDYPYVYNVVVDGDQFIGFDTNLPSSREPFTAGFVAFDRTTVYEVDEDGTFDTAGHSDKQTVNAVIDALGDL